MYAEPTNEDQTHGPFLGCKIHKFSKLLLVIKLSISGKAYQTLGCSQLNFASRQAPCTTACAGAKLFWP
jgi:hypothetical protein